MYWTHMELLVSAIWSVLVEKLHLRDDTPNPYPIILQFIAVHFITYQ